MSRHRHWGVRELPLSATEVIQAHPEIFRQIFPYSAPLASALTRELRARANVVLRRPENKSMASAVGSAAEFAVCWHYGAAVEELTSRVPLWREEGQRLAALLRGALTELRLMHATLADAAPLLSPPFLLLGQIDATFRAGYPLPVIPPEVNALLEEVRGSFDPPLSVILADCVAPSLDAEFTELLEATAEFLGTPPSAEARWGIACNPAFSSHGWLRGADADLIANGTVVEVKVLGGAEPEIRPAYLWQLFTYAALSRLGTRFSVPELEVGRIAVWELRRQYRWEQSLEEVSRVTAGVPWETACERLLEAFVAMGPMLGIE